MIFNREKQKKERKVGGAALLLLVAIAFLWGGCTNPKKQKVEHLKNAMTYIEKGDNKAGIIELKNAIQIDPKYAEAHYQLGLVYLKIGDIKGALGELERAVSLDPQNPEALQKLGELMFLSRKLKESQEMATKILALDPKNIGGLVLQANIYLAGNKIKEANQTVDEALTFEPDNARLYLVKAKVFLQQAKPQEAEKELKRAIAKAPTDMNVAQALLTFYMSQGMLAEAETQLRSMLQIFPKHPKLYFELASLLLRQGKIDEAEKNMQHGVAIDPNDPSLSVVMGNFYQKINRTEDAVVAYKKAIALTKETEKKEGYQALLANYYFKKQKFDAARDLLDQILKKNPKHPLARLIKAKFLIREKKYTDALAILDELLNKQPQWGEAYYQKALAHFDLGETALSFNAVNEAVKYSPNASDGHILLAQLIFLKRDFEGAKKEAALALRLRPNNLRSAVIAGKAMLGNKEADNALKLFQQMEKAVPDNSEIRYYKALSLLALGRKPEASNILTDILNKEPDFAPVLVALTGMDEQDGKIGEAIARVEKQVKLLPENGTYQQLLGILLVKDKQYEKAVICFRKAEQLDPQNPKNYVMLASIRKQQGKLDDAIVEYQELVKVKPDYAPAFTSLGTLLQLEGNIAEAKEAYKQALALDGSFAPAANNLAWLVAEEEQPDLGEALRLALIAKEKRPEDPYIADTLGLIHYKRESYDLALTQFSQAVEGLPDKGTVRYHMALALNALNKKEEARQELVKALGQKSEFPERQKAQTLLLDLQKTKG